MKYCIELNKKFASNEDMFKSLKVNSDKIIALKRSAIKTSDAISNTLQVNDDIEKRITFLEKDFIYPVINTIGLMDSHRDVHKRGLFNKSVKEQQGKIYYVKEHQLDLDSVIAYPNDVELMLKDISWEDLGYSYTGKTQALIYKINQEAIVDDKIKKLILEKRPFQNSVRMQYVKISLAMNSESEDNEKEKELYDNNIDWIANKDEVENLGYFWLVEEAKIMHEGSLVLFGSNSATPILQKTDIIEPLEEPSKDTLKDTQIDREFIKELFN